LALLSSNKIEKTIGTPTIAAWGIVKSVESFTCMKKSQNVNFQLPFQVLTHWTSVSEPTKQTYLSNCHEPMLKLGLVEKC